MSLDVEKSLEPPPPRVEAQAIPKKPWTKPTVTVFMDLDGTRHGSDSNAAEIQTNPADNYVAS